MRCPAMGFVGVFMIGCGGASAENPKGDDDDDATYGVELTSDSTDSETTSSTETDTTDTETTSSTETIPLPTPVFTIGSTPGGDIALDEDGFRTYTYKGVEYYSAIYLTLYEEGASDGCSVVIDPKLDDWGYASPSNRQFEAMVIDIGGSTVLAEDCGWELDYVVAEFAARGTIEIGLAQARFEEDRPFLDVYWDRSWGLPNQTANIVYAGYGVGFELTAAGVLDPSAAYLQTPSGSLVPGFYSF